MHSSCGADILTHHGPLCDFQKFHCYVCSSEFRVRCFLNIHHSFAGRKFEHALKHGPRNGLFVVTLGWFVDCVRRNSKPCLIISSPCSVFDELFLVNYLICGVYATVRLDESLYSIKNMGENGLPLGEFNRLVGVPVSEQSCLPPMIFQDKACSGATQKHQLQGPREKPEHDLFVFANDTIYIDPGISGEMKKKVCSISIASSFRNG